MSGIAGMLRFDGQPVVRSDVERMANALRPHGPDRSGIVLAGDVGFAHVLMKMTPEDRHDEQPTRGSSGNLITADLRLDNRDEILAVIGLPLHEAMAWSDARVLLAGWEKFRDEIWAKLRGPFAVAIWEPRSRTLTLARDHLGLNVVMWHRGKYFFAFSTMPKGLFALPDVPRMLNEEKFADSMVLNHADHATTHYQGVFRILPAHFAKFDCGGSMWQRRYWSLNDIKPVRLPTDRAYAEGLRECLNRSVRRQMRSAHPIGSHLTGGLDSSSVSVLAARSLKDKGERLAAFTQVPRVGFDAVIGSGCYADETPYVEAIRLLAGNIDVNYIRNDECDDFAELERFFLALEGPVRNPTALGWMLAIARNARAQGRRVLLGGLWGNYTISWSGWSQVIDHLMSGRLVTAWRQWRLFYRCSAYSRWRALNKLIGEPLLSRGLASSIVCRSEAEPWLNHAAIRSELASELQVKERAEQVGHDFFYRFRRGERARGLTAVDYVGDWFAAEKAVTGVETRDPTADIDVVSFCFGIPPEQYLVEDVDRSLIRRAMWGLLPEIVLTNRRSGIQSADWYEKLGKRRPRLAAEISELSASPLAGRFIDFVRLESAIENWPTGDWQKPSVVDEYHFAFTRGVAAARFLRWFEARNH